MLNKVVTLPEDIGGYLLSSVDGKNNKRHFEYRHPFYGKMGCIDHLDICVLVTDVVKLGEERIHTVKFLYKEQICELSVTGSLLPDVHGEIFNLLQ
jgi:hypothetical protein